MADPEKYARWLIENQEKKGTPEFETVAEAYRAFRGGVTPPPEVKEPSVADRALRFGGLAARTAMKAGTFLPALMAELPAAAGRYLTGGKYFPSPMAELERRWTAGGLPEPQPGIERTSYDIASAMGGVGAQARVAQGIAQSAPFSQSAGSGVARVLAGQPGLQIAGGGTGAGAASVAHEKGLPPWMQIALGAGGSMLPFGAQAGGSLVLQGLGKLPLVKNAANFIDPWLPGGVDRAVGRTMREAAGPQAAQVEAALNAAREIVPGSRPTAGQAAAGVGRAEISGLEKVTRGRRPSEYDAVLGSQEEARLNAIRTIGKDEKALADAITDRNLVTRPMRESALDATKATNVYIGQLLRRIRGLKSRPEWAADDTVKAVLDDVVEKLKDLKTDQFGHVSGRHLYSVRKSIGNKIKTMSAEGKTPDQRLAAGLQREVQKYIDDAIEGAGGAGWKDYLKKYQELSGPINRMEVGQELEKALTSALDPGVERPAVFANAVRNAGQTIKRSSGQSRFDKLSDILTPDEMKTVNSVLEDLQRSAENVRLGRIGTERAADLTGTIAPSLPQAGMFNPKYSVARALSNRLSGRVEGRAIDRLAELMASDPKQLAALMKRLPPAARARLLHELGIAQGAATIPYTQGR